jgi:hypothetical protein
MSLINKAECKRLLLGLAERKWPGKFTRVAGNVYGYLEDDLRMTIEGFIRQHPTLGKTLTTGEEPEQE